MSRLAKRPISVPSGVQVILDGRNLSLKGAKGELSTVLNEKVRVSFSEQKLSFSVVEGFRDAWVHAGTTRALLNNMIVGVSSAFEKRLILFGVGFKAKAQGKSLNLTLGYSHPIDYQVPPGVLAETPSPTEIVLKSIDKRLLGQVAADIRSFRPPEPYKGKGLRYSDEKLVLKETKKK